VRHVKIETRERGREIMVNGETRDDAVLSKRHQRHEQVDAEADEVHVLMVTVDPQRVTIGLVLDVIPQVGADGGIMMNIHPSITELVGEEVFPPGAETGEVLANAPVLDIREVDTMVRVPDGQLLVIGGLVKERQRDEVRKVPILGDIPLVGYVFRQTRTQTEQVELVIALRTRVLVGKAASEMAERELEKLLGAF